MAHKIKILIVEDEYFIKEDLCDKLGKSGYEICGTADNCDSALELFNKQNPDIVLLDIHVHGEIDGIEIGKKMQEIKRTPIIFLTALANKPTISRAKEAYPSAYIIKPYIEKQLDIAIELALHNFHADGGNQAVSPAQNKQAPDNNHYFQKERIFLKVNGRFEKILLDEILWIESDHNYSTIVTVNQKYVLIDSLVSIEEKLSHPHFLRVHRSYIVNMQKVDSFEEYRLFIQKAEIPVSKTHRPEIIRHFKLL